MSSSLKEEKDLQEIIRLADKALKYLDSDPETALMHGRKAAEIICKDIFCVFYLTFAQ